MTRHLCSLALPFILAMAGSTLSAHAEDARSNGGVAASGPVFSDTGPDAADYGAAAAFPLGARGTASQLEHLVGVYSHFDELFPSRSVPRATATWLFKRAPEPAISDNLGRERLAIETYLSRNPTTGLLIAKDDTILYEYYQYARTDRDRFLSQSMAKTITSMLIGVAVSEGKIKSIDDPVTRYVPELKGSAYEGVSVRQMLMMSSGVKWNEDYTDPKSDVAVAGGSVTDPGVNPMVS